MLETLVVCTLILSLIFHNVQLLTFEIQLKTWRSVNPWDRRPNDGRFSSNYEDITDKENNKEDNREDNREDNKENNKEEAVEDMVKDKNKEIMTINSHKKYLSH